MHEDQYPIVAARRQGYDNLLWQVPTIGVAAQGFLVAAALGEDIASNLSAFLLFSASVVGVAVVWLFRRLRFHEVADSELLKEYEQSREAVGFTVTHGRRGPQPSAYYVWLVILGASVILEVGGAVIQAFC